mmetsp:Transcript_40347/g.102473  ORF Transcript_40347/g.102473 Transcript_40347/m.102473 type:complete len:223 (-) Transcript_40347:596-1264(-)
MNNLVLIQGQDVDERPLALGAPGHGRRVACRREVRLQLLQGPELQAALDAAVVLARTERPTRVLLAVARMVHDGHEFCHYPAMWACALQIVNALCWLQKAFHQVFRDQLHWLAALLALAARQAQEECERSPTSEKVVSLIHVPPDLLRGPCLHCEVEVSPELDGVLDHENAAPSPEVSGQPPVRRLDPLTEADRGDVGVPIEGRRHEPEEPQEELAKDLWFQ